MTNNELTFNFGTKYCYELLPTAFYNTCPAAVLYTDHRANSKGFKEEVRKIRETTGCYYRQYSNKNSNVLTIKYINN